jgi:glycosyltransferase involved in cell wall biosynthesis
VTTSALTVLMPVRAYREDYLREAIGSLTAQTSPAWQALVVLEPEDLDAFGARHAELMGDERIRVIANEGRKLAGALNTGMRHAGTDFAAILFADDLWSPDAVEVLTRAIASRPDADFFHSSRRIVDEAGRPISEVYRSLDDVKAADFVRMAPVKHLLCWRVSKALSFGGMDESLNSVGPDDYDFPWTMAEHGAVFVAVPECLYIYRDHREVFRLTTHLSLSTHTRELRRILRKHGAGRAEVRRRVAEARRTYLQQCLYRSPLDRMLKRLRGADDAHAGWRESYD